VGWISSTGFLLVFCSNHSYNMHRHELGECPYMLAAGGVPASCTEQGSCRWKESKRASTHGLLLCTSVQALASRRGLMGTGGMWD